MMREPDAFEVEDALDAIVVATAECDLDEAERLRKLARRRLVNCRVMFFLLPVFGAAGWLVGRWWR